MYYIAATSLDLNQAWNMSWGEGIQFILVLAFLYWLKKRIDLHFAKKTSKIVYKVKIVDDSHISVDHARHAITSSRLPSWARDDHLVLVMIDER